MSGDRAPIEWWGVGKTAEYLGVHRSTLHRWPPEALPYTEAGQRRNRRYLADDVRAFAATYPRAMASAIDDHETRIARLEQWRSARR